MGKTLSGNLWTYAAGVESGLFDADLDPDTRAIVAALVFGAARLSADFGGMTREDVIAAWAGAGARQMYPTVAVDRAAAIIRNV